MITNYPPDDVKHGLLLVALVGLITTCADKQKDDTRFLAKEEACLSDRIQADAKHHHDALLALDTPRVAKLPLDRRPRPSERALHDSTRMAYENHMRRLSEAEAFSSYAASRKHAYAMTYAADSARFAADSAVPKWRPKDKATPPDVLRFEHRARMHTMAAAALDRTIRMDLASLYARRMSQAAIDHGAPCRTP